MLKENIEFRNLRGMAVHVGQTLLLEGHNEYGVDIGELELRVTHFTRTLIVAIDPKNGKEFYIDPQGYVRGNWRFYAYPSREVRDLVKLMNHLDKSTKTIRGHVEVLAQEGRFQEATKLIDSLLESFNKLNSK